MARGSTPDDGLPHWRTLARPSRESPRKLCKLWERWSDKGTVARKASETADQGGETETPMIDTAHRMTGRTVSNLGQRQGVAGG